MYTSIIEFIALVWLIGGVWHAMRWEPKAFARQWFIPAYLAALTRETLNQVIFQVYIFAPAVMRLGNTPALLTLLTGGAAYIAYAFAKRWIDPNRVGAMTGLVFLIVASLALPIEATAAQLRWWIYTTEPVTVLGGVPVFAPLAWGGSAAIFYVVFWRINQARLVGQGKFYAMVAASPIIAVAQMLLVILLGA
jgi:hypothetical protein